MATWSPEPPTTNKTAHTAFPGGVACPECGLDHATIVSAEALRRLGPEPKPQERGSDDASIRRAITRHEREIEKLRAAWGVVEVPVSQIGATTSISS